MRVAWLVFLAGCYQPGREGPCTVSCTTSCPSHLTCVNGWCTGANGPTCGGDGGVIDIDAPPDGSGRPSCTPATVSGAETQVTLGEWFTVRLDAEAYATKFQLEDLGTGPVGVIRGTRFNPSGTYSLAFTDDMTYRYRSPHLSHDGLELFMRLEPIASNTASIARAQRGVGGDVWTVLTPLSITGIPALAVTDDPSTPTQTSPRRMVISHGANGFSEIEEVSAASWIGVHEQLQATYATDDLNVVTILGQAHLSGDGLRVVFRGQVGTQNVGAFYLDRTSLADTFAPPARRLPTAGSVQHPFLTNDCRFLFYDRPNDGFVYRVAYP